MNVWMNTYYGPKGAYLIFNLSASREFRGYISQITLDTGSKLVIL